MEERSHRVRRREHLAREEIVLRSSSNANRPLCDSSVLLLSLVGVFDRLPSVSPSSSSSSSSLSSSPSSPLSVVVVSPRLSPLASSLLSISLSYRSRLLLSRYLYLWRASAASSLVSSKLAAASALVTAALEARTIVDEQARLIDGLECKLHVRAKSLIEQCGEIDKLTAEKAKGEKELKERNERIKALERNNHVLAFQVRGLLAKNGKLTNGNN